MPPNDSLNRWPLARSKSLAILCIGAVKLAAQGDGRFVRTDGQAGGEQDEAEKKLVYGVRKLRFGLPMFLS